MRAASTLILLLALSSAAQAGMTVITLTDVAKMRIESLSFFIAAYLLMALFVKWLWNYLAKSFEKLPTLNYRRALALALISGLFLYVVLTMISGARELLTPGAWQKKGYGYKLEESAASGPDRSAQAVQLRDSLWEFAKQNDGRFPSSLFIDEITLTGAQNHFAFIPTSGPSDEKNLLAYEINTSAKTRTVILNDGSLETWETSKVKEMLQHER